MAGEPIRGSSDSNHFTGERHDLAIRPRRWAYAVWLIVIGGFAVLHALHLSADFPNNTPWIFDWAKYTDEGWYGNAAVRAHLFGNWYLRGDFNPAAGGAGVAVSRVGDVQFHRGVD